MTTENENETTCTACGVLVPLCEYYDGEHYSTDCRANRGLVPCDSAVCLAKDAPATLEEFKDAYAHWRFHVHLCGCSHGR